MGEWAGLVCGRGTVLSGCGAGNRSTYFFGYHRMRLQIATHKSSDNAQ